ncbi:unnamed protein product [Allacma fusca]|uniref:Glutamate--cysteine ligase n=1 Tax=Allacma fusca TaxID=39272 RepID=A0A8J2K8T2_9HEXA|nr:unnamed protein product [Allacma fusca]
MIWEKSSHYLLPKFGFAFGCSCSILQLRHSKYFRGSPLTWEETKKWAEHVKTNGIQQFINLYKRLQHRQGDCLKWGDEVEYIIVRFDHSSKNTSVSLRANEVLPILRQPENDHPESVKSLWRPEYASYMVEGTPGKPYGALPAHLNIVEANMTARRKEAQQQLPLDETVLSIANFPRLGCPGFTYPVFNPKPESSVSRSLFFPDEAIFQGHPRFTTLTRNIRSRRGSKIDIQVPIFKDVNTPSPFIEEGVDEQKPDHIYMDAMGFGMGCCCLQVTFQACNISEARTLYDNLAPLCPIMLALTAATPFFRGHIADVDCRWNVISGSVDCRQPSERERIRKSRYDSIDSYLSEDGAEFNDIPIVYEEEHYKALLEGGIDPLLAQHVAHLFIRDPVSLFSEKIHQDNLKDSDHFENIQSTNWQTMRFKPPPPESSIGWRVEFRPCEVQLTDFENAAVVCFIVLLTRVVLSYKLCFLMPMSKVDENMARAQKKNAVLDEKFWFRNDIRNKDKKEYSLMTVSEIINGKDDFPGLISLIQTYLNSMDVDADSQCTLQKYLCLISKRARGELDTAAKWLRDFATSHPGYKKDSVITEEINYDLMCRISSLPVDPCPNLLGTLYGSKTTEDVPDILTK